MLIIERQQRVLAILKQQGSAQLEELARALDVSASTIRRDLEMFEKKGVVQRTHGGAVYNGPAPASLDATTRLAASASASSSSSPQPSEASSAGASSSVALSERMNEHVQAKMAIGKYAASLVQPQMTLLLDGGSTVFYTAKQITARPIQVVTNSLSIANLFADDDQVELLIVGGNHYPRTGVLIGPITTGCLADLHADLLMLSVAGIYGNEAYNQNLGMTQVEQAMMRQAAQTVMLMDSSKFGRKSLSRVCSIDEVDQLVTDQGIASEWVDRLGERLVVAE